MNNQKHNCAKQLYQLAIILFESLILLSKFYLNNKFNSSNNKTGYSNNQFGLQEKYTDI